MNAKCLRSITLVVLCACILGLVAVVVWLAVFPDFRLSRRDALADALSRDSVKTKMIPRADTARFAFLAAWVERRFPTGSRAGNFCRLKDYSRSGYDPELMLRHAAKGGLFTPEDRTVLLVKATRALGERARLVRLERDDGRRRLMVEYFLPTKGYWALYDALTGQFLLLNGKPMPAVAVLSAITTGDSMAVCGAHGLSHAEIHPYFSHIRFGKRGSCAREELIWKDDEPMCVAMLNAYTPIFLTTNATLVYRDLTSDTWHEWPEKSEP